MSGSVIRRLKQRFREEEVASQNKGVAQEREKRLRRQAPPPKQEEQHSIPVKSEPGTST